MTLNQQPRIMISAGEASGDQLGSGLSQAIKKQCPHATLYGMGGAHMQQAGVEIIVNYQDVSVVGIIEVLKHLGTILSARKTLIDSFKQNPPDLLILIDLPDFNLNLAKHAKRHGIKVLYYVSPQIWAWRYGRIKKIKQRVDHMAVLFPFEKTLYEKEQVPATFVGHPLMEKAKASITPEAAYERFALNKAQPIIALLPGSRHSEINRLMPVLMEAAEKTLAQIPSAQFVLALAPNLAVSDVAPYVNEKIRIIENDFHNILSITDAAITVSGTATLEVALHQVPLVVIYKVSQFSYWVGRCLIRTPYIALCNIVAEKAIAREFIQAKANAENICNETFRLLNDVTYRKNILKELKILKEKTGHSGASERAASVALDLLR